MASSVSTKIFYEQPLNERVRTFLRLEFLFRQTQHHLAGPSPWDSRAALSSLLEILHIFGRGDLKTEVMKELERHTGNLARLERNPDVDRARLGQILDELEQLIDRLHAMNGQAGRELAQNEFLSSLLQRSAIPGGTCDFDMPAYHFWLQKAPEERMRDVAAWLENFDPVAQSVRLVLNLTRDSSRVREEHAQAGFFQKALDANIPCQLVRVAVPSNAPYFAEISGGRHRFTVRFMQMGSLEERATQTPENVTFEMACCVI